VKTIPTLQLPSSSHDRSEPDASSGVVLVVDDDPVVRKLTRDILMKVADAVHVVSCGEDALRVAPQLDPDLILLDVTMPGIDGFEVCTQLRANPQTREVPIIMVTALNDRASRLRGIEAGADDFLTKPYDRMELRARVKTILRVNRYRRLMEEREQRQRAWQGALKVLSEMFAMREPDTFGVAQRVERRAIDLARRLRIQDTDSIRLAAMFCQLGRLVIPDSVLTKAASNLHLSRAEQGMMRAIPESSSTILANIPELRGISKIVYWQDKNYDGTGFPLDDLDGRTIPVASRIIRVARDFEQLIEDGLSSDEAQLRLHAHDRWYDPAVLTALDAQLLDEAAEFAMRAMTVRLADLRIGMEILEDIITTDDRLVVVGAGTAITGPMLERLHNFARIKGIREPIVIKRPDAFLSGITAA
jgi:putative two-component system response regulator